MKKIFFLHHDHERFMRQSHGLCFVISTMLSPHSNGQNVCVYCNEYDTFAFSVEDFAQHNFLEHRKSIHFSAANLFEIYSQGLIHWVDAVDCFDTNTKQSHYIEFKNNNTPLNDIPQAFFYHQHGLIDELLFCHVQQYYDENIYLYSPARDCLWLMMSSFNELTSAIPRKNLKIRATSLNDIANLVNVDYISGVGIYQCGQGRLTCMNKIDF